MSFKPEKSVIIITKLKEAGYEAYYVGGCVRDYLLDNEPKDYDICTNATPDQVKKVIVPFCDDILDTGIKFGTISAVLDDELYEITTYRSEGRYDDNRHPNEVHFEKSLIKDLSRRDFTINAMALDYPSMNIIDPFDGQVHCIKDHVIIQCVGNPNERFIEDPLRMLRAYRFNSRYKNSRISESTREAIQTHADKILNISNERICKELTEIIVNKKLSSFMDSPLFSFLFPEVEILKTVKQHNKYHMYDAFVHTQKVVGAIEHSGFESERKNDNICLSLAALFHDIGKKQTETTDSEGEDHFYGHATVSAELTEQILRKYHFPKRIVTNTTTMVLYHEYLQQSSCTKLLKRVKDPLLACMIAYLRVGDILGQGFKRNALERFTKALQDCQDLINYLMQEKPFLIKDLDISGKDLLDMGYKEGPQIGKILRACLNAVIDGQVKNSKDSLIDFIHKEKECFVID